MIIHPITGNRYKLDSSRGRNLLKYYISQYKRGGALEEENQTCIMCMDNLGVTCEDTTCISPGSVCDVVLNCGHKFHYCCFKGYFTNIQETAGRFGALPSYWNGIDLATPTCPLCRTHIVSVFPVNVDRPRETRSEPWRSMQNLLIAGFGVDDGFTITYEGDVPIFNYRTQEDRNSWRTGMGLLSERFKALVDKMVQIQTYVYERDKRILSSPKIYKPDGTRTGIPDELQLIYMNHITDIRLLDKLHDKAINDRTSAVYDYILFHILFMSDHDYDRLNSDIDEFISTSNGGMFTFVNSFGPPYYVYDSSNSTQDMIQGLSRNLSWQSVSVNNVFHLSAEYAALGSLILISILTDYCDISVVKRLIDCANIVGGFKNIIIDNSFIRLSPLNDIFPGLVTRNGNINPDGSHNTYFNTYNPIVDIIVQKFYFMYRSLLPDDERLTAENMVGQNDIGANLLEQYINMLRSNYYSSLPPIDYVDNIKRGEYMDRLIIILQYIMDIVRSRHPSDYEEFLDSPIADMGFTLRDLVTQGDLIGG